MIGVEVRVGIGFRLSWLVGWLAGWLVGSLVGWLVEFFFFQMYLAVCA